MNNLKNREFIKFLIVGFVNTFFGLMVIYFAKSILDADDVSSNVIGYIFGVLVSFALNSEWTFFYKGSRMVAFVKFILIALIAYAVNLLTVLISIYYFKLDSYLAQALGVPPYALVSFFANKYFVFCKVIKN